MNNYTPKEGITDARQLGMHKYIILGIQHLFAMFGSTILVPVLTIEKKKRLAAQKTAQLY